MGDSDHTVHLEYTYLELEPLGLIFLLFFAVVLLLQIVGMLIHRIMTLGHIVSSTKVRLTFKKILGKEDKIDPEKLIEKYGVDFIKQIQRQDDDTTDRTPKDLESKVED